MISVHECSDLSSILDLKADYLRSLIVPMDNVWEVGFTQVSPRWEIRSGGDRPGYYTANDQGELLQFYVTSAFGREARALFDHVISQASLPQAVVSTIDPSYLSLCLDVQDKVTVHVLASVGVETDGKKHVLGMREGASENTEVTTALLQDLVERDLDPKRRRLLVIDGSKALRKAITHPLGAGHPVQRCRNHKLRNVHGHLPKDQHPLRLRVGSKALGVPATCSTTVENVAAQRAITRTGFASRHRVMNVSLASG
jgi:transposase-like protein